MGVAFEKVKKQFRYNLEHVKDFRASPQYIRLFKVLNKEQLQELMQIEYDMYCKHVDKLQKEIKQIEDKSRRRMGR